MLELKITIVAAELAAAINNLAVAIGGSQTKSAVNEPAPVSTAPAAQPTNPTMPVHGVPLSATAAQPAAPAADPIPVVPTAAIPTAAPQYTLEMIATAGTALMDTGKMEQLMQLLTKFGITNLTQLAPENYGAFANELRALGAAI
ncbi:MAG: hypothetical protein HFE63_11090 [Clostridiales bacterium]|nr:hypothetical protein [Clostridiales bacterium]